MWYICERRKMKYLLIYAILTLTYPVLSKTIITAEDPVTKDPADDNFDNNIIDLDEDYSVKFDKQYGVVPWHSTDKFNKESHRYTIIKDDVIAPMIKPNKENKTSVDIKKESDTQIKSNDKAKQIVEETTPTADYSVIPLELVSTTENVILSIVESTTEPELAVIPLSTTKKTIPDIEIKQTVILPSTQSPEITTEYFTTTIENVDQTTSVTENNETTTAKREITTRTTETATETTVSASTTTENVINSTTTTKLETLKIKVRNVTENPNKTKILETTTESLKNTTKLDKALNTNTTKQIETVQRADFGSSESQEDVPIFTELDTEDLTDVPDDYYDSKDVVPTTAPKTDALSVIFGLAGSVVESMVESVAERVVPKGIFDLFKRMQRQNEALEAERLRSREENGGLGQFTRGILKSISSGLSKPLSQLMAGAKDIGSLDTDRGFVSSVASGVSSVANVANSVVDAFKDRVQAIYPGTVWCGDGHSATARSSDLGLFFFTDTCCRQHDACKIYIRSGETKYGLTNTGLFTRSHCSCDAKFRECLRKTNSLVSAQIGLTYFNVLGPQCFRRSHPIVRCVKRTRITGQKCEEYELDFTKSKMWQWFDNETF